MLFIWLIGTAVHVPAVGAMAVYLPAWDGADPTLGPYTDQDPETEVVRPSNPIQVLIPGRYAALLVHRRRVNPRMAYQEIAGVIQARGEMESCHDVVVWLHAA
jgi:hypothetical protein